MIRSLLSRDNKVQIVYVYLDESKMSSLNTLKLVHGRNKSSSCDIFQFGATVISWKVHLHLADGINYFHIN